MAFVTVKNGTVGRNLKDKGFELLETYLAAGNEYTKRYAVWCSPEFIPIEGERVDVTGILSVTATISDRDGKAYANLSINKPRIDAPKFEAGTVAGAAALVDEMPF